MNHSKIGKFILKLRTENNMSQYQLADKIPISRQAVSKWERGETIPDSSTLIRLSEIFDVTINELLNGEKNTIKDLETTTLSILDENQKKTKIVKRLLQIFIPTITILIISFLGYYFINSYNSIKVYMISGEGKEFDIYDGVLITTKQKSYLKLGKIQNRNNHTIHNIRFYYIEKDHEKIIFEDKDIDLMVIDLYGYNELIPNKEFNIFLKQFYIEIIYDDRNIEIIQLDFHRDFINNSLLFPKKTIIDKTNKEKADEHYSQIEKQVLEIMEKEGEKQENSIILYLENEEQIIYYKDLREFIFMKDQTCIWYLLIDNRNYQCLNQEKDTKNCLEYIQRDLEKITNKQGRT